MDGRATMKSENYAIVNIYQTPRTFHTAVACIEGVFQDDDFLKKAKSFEDEFRKRLMETADKRNKMKVLIEFVEKYMLHGERFKSSNSATREDNADANGYSKDIFYKENDEIIYSRESADEVKGDIQWSELPFVAISENRIDILEICSETGLDLNMFRGRTEMNLLMYGLSSKNVNVEIIDFLFKQIKANFITESGKTAFNFFLGNQNLSTNQKLETTKKLIEAGAPINSSKHVSSSALHLYINSFLTITEGDKIENWQDFVDMLIAAGLEIDSRDWLGQTALMMAVIGVPPQGYEDMFPDEEKRAELQKIRNCKISLIKYLLHAGADPNAEDFSGQTCAHIAACNQTVDVIKILLENNCRVNTQTNLGLTPIYSMCTAADWTLQTDVDEILVPMLKLLVAKGCDINMKGRDQSTALHFAAAKCNTYVCKQLLKLGADVTSRDYLRRTPLHLSARNEDPKVAGLLLEFNSDIHARDINGCTALHVACVFDKLEIAQLLIEHGADFNAEGDLGILPIHLTAENGSADFIAYFCIVGNIHAIDHSGDTPLHYAASDGNLETVEYLINIGADTTVKDNSGNTAFDLATFRGYLSVAALLTTNPTNVHFGQMPPSVFPNRPLVPVSMVDKYFENLTKTFLENGRFGIDLAKDILDTSGLGIVSMDSGEENEIKKKVIGLADDIVRRVGEIDSLFQCKLIPAGSSSEGVKNGYPNEFDFICEVKPFIEFVERLEPGATSGFTKVILKDSAPEEMKKYCVRESRVLNAAFFLRYFGRLCRMATYDVLSAGHSHIYAGMMLLPDSSPLFSDEPIPLAKLLSLSFTYRGMQYKFLDISVDLNPVLHIQEIPDELNTVCSILPDMAKMGIYVIPKTVQVHGVPLEKRSDLWRYSTNHIEAEIMRKIPQKARESYTLCKAFRMEPLTCSVKTNNTFQDTLRTRNLTVHKVGDFHQEESLSSDNTSSANRSDEEDSLNTDKDQMDSDAIPEDEELDVGLECEEDDEVTAEKAIPSYYLKTIFIKEIENLNVKREKFDDKCMTSLPRRVYEKLQRAFEENTLCSLFLPHHNDLYKASYRTEPLILNMRKIYCANILKFMEQMGFVDEL